MNAALKWKLIAGFLLVFIAGGMTGAFFGASHVRHLFFESPRHGIIGERMRERLRAQLNLTPDQVAQVSPIIEKTAAQLEQERRDTGKRVHELMITLHREIAAHLTEAQRAKLKEMEEHRERWHGRGFHRRGSPAAESATP